MGDIENDFEMLSEFDYTDNLSLTSSSTFATSFNKKSKMSNFSSIKSRSFRQRLVANFLKDNLWFSIFLNRTWSNYNSRARITIAKGI